MVLSKEMVERVSVRDWDVFESVIVYSNKLNKHKLSNTNINCTVYFQEDRELINYCFIKGINYSIINNKTIHQILEKNTPGTLLLVDSSINDTLFNITSKKGLTVAYVSSPKSEKYICGNCGSHILNNVICQKTECKFNITTKKSNMKKIKSTDSISFKSEQSDKEKKMQKTILIEANRRAYLERKERFKRDMKKLSSNKIYEDSNNKPKRKSKPIKNCSATTKSGKPCSNKALKGSDYCGILSHRSLPDSKIKKIDAKKISQELGVPEGHCMEF